MSGTAPVAGSTVGSGRGRTLVDPWGRAKAYRPLLARHRRALLHAGLLAFARGDFFAAHEILEPAWMGARDPVERSLYQGLIKLAAALVHGVRGNPSGVRINLVGARARLLVAAERADEVSSGPAERRAPAARAAATALGRVDLAAALAWIDAALRALDRGALGAADLGPLLESAERLPLRRRARAAPRAGPDRPA